MFWVQITVIGVAVGCIYALAGMGLVLTYKATGIFNFAHGAVGVLVAYILFQLNAEWGVPIGIAAPLAVLVAGPGIGMLLERLVFRPLQRGGATTTEKLVATLGVFVLFLGIIVTIWTANSRFGPELFSHRGFDVAEGLRVGYDHIGYMVTLAVISLGLWGLFRFTHLGTEIRAVVDKPELAELASINANRISSIAWGLGAALAGLSGVLFAAGQLDPFRLTLFMLETLSVAVLARLTSLPLAVAYGVLVLGVGRALFAEWSPISGDNIWRDLFEELKPNFSVLVLFLAVLAYRRLDTVGEAAEQQGRLVARVRSSDTPPWLVPVVIGTVLLVMPAFLDATGFASAHRFLAMTVIFASIVAVTGFSGQITLGQAGFAGFGAFIAARAAGSWGIPVIFAMLLGGAAAFVAGTLAGYPALRRRGLFLALTTLAFGLFIYGFVIGNSVIAGDTTGLQVARPSILWWNFHSDLAFYYFDVAVVGLILLLARNLRSGPLGRALAAMRDSEAGATSVGIDLRRYKVFIFAVSSFMAGIGGVMLTQQSQVFNALQFFPLESLFWFAVVVVAGVSSITGAVLGAFVFVMLDVVIDIDGLSQLMIGAGALLLGRLPGGSLVGMFREGFDRAVLAGRRSLADARRQPEPAIAHTELQPSAFAQAVLAAPPPAPPLPPPVDGNGIPTRPSGGRRSPEPYVGHDR